MYDKIVESNKKFWSKENERSEKNGVLIYECFYSIPQMCYGISKVALCISKSLNLKPMVLLPWRRSLLTESMCDTHLQMKNSLLSIIINNLFFLTSIFFINKHKLLDLKIGDVKVGTYIYDSILRRYNKKTINRLTLRERSFVCLEMCYFFYFKKVLTKYDVKAVVLGDSVYRYGLIFGLCKENGIPCFTPVDLNSLFIKKYSNKSNYDNAFLTQDILKQQCAGVDYKKIIDDYYIKRYEGNIIQHDVLTAYANKLTSSHDEFYNKYCLDKNKKTVVVMCHVFADAPHVYLKTLYDDYWDWFVRTLSCLLENKQVNVLVKEHPSSHLYGQKGIVSDYLKENGYGNLQISETESTLSVIRNADIVVTCGGTIGLEFSYAKKRVVLASRPPYGELGFTEVFESRLEYEDFLKFHIQELEELPLDKHRIALQASYVSFCCQNNWSKKLELGGDIILLNGTYDDNKLWTKIQQYNQVPLKEQEIYKLLNNFIKSGDIALFNGNTEKELLTKNVD